MMSMSRSTSADFVTIVHRARHSPFALDRLVGIGVGAEGDRIAAVAGLRELGAQQCGGVGLRIEFRLEVESRRQVEVRVRRPCIAIDAAVLAALVWIDRLRERDVGRRVGRDDRAGALDRDRRPQRWRCVVAGVRRRLPAVVARLARVDPETVRRVERGAAPFLRRRRRFAKRVVGSRRARCRCARRIGTGAHTG